MKVEKEIPGGKITMFPLEGWLTSLNGTLAIEIPVFFRADEGRSEAGTVWLGTESLAVAEHEARRWAERYTNTDVRSAHDA